MRSLWGILTVAVAGATLAGCVVAPADYPRAYVGVGVASPGYYEQHYYGGYYGRYHDGHHYRHRDYRGDGHHHR